MRKLNGCLWHLLRRQLILLAIVALALSIGLGQAAVKAEEPEGGIGGGGMAGTLLFLDLSALNRVLAAHGYGPLDDTLSLIGGGGFGGTIGGLRFGGLGGGGEVSSVLGEKIAKLSLGFGGFLIERGLFAGERYSLSVGAVIGGGGADLTLLDHRSASFEDAIANPSGTRLTRGFFAVETHFGLEVALLDWIMLRVDVGYLWTFGGSWEQEGSPLLGPPESLSAPLVRFMIAFGGKAKPEPEEERATIESGGFVIEQGGVEVGREDFRLEQTEDGFQLISTVRLTVMGHALTLDQQLELAPDLSPAHYRLKGETPQGKQWIDAVIEDGKAQLQVLVGEQTQKRELAGEPPLVVLDNNVMSHLAVIYRFIRQTPRQEGQELQMTALVPQVLLTVPLKAKPPEAATLKSGDRTIPVEKHLIQLGDLQIALYGQDETLLVIDNPLQQVFAYRKDLLPEGVEIVTAAAEKEARLPEGVQEVELAFTSDGLKLMGTLTLPADLKEPVPGVLLLPGSGPVDRDENMPGLKLDFLKAVAHRLAQAGIGSFRYDKRGVGKSEGVFSQASMTDLLNDARSALKLLKSREEIDPEHLLILGHSEGAILGPLLAAEGLVQAVILVAGTAHPLDWILVEQTRLINEAMGLPPEQVEERVEQSRKFVQFVKETQGDWEDFTFEQVKEYLPWLTREEFEGHKQGMSLRWWREHFAHDPLETIRQVKVPVLIIQGEKDLQVPKGEAELLAQALKEAGNDDVELHVLPDLNHLMRYHPEEPTLQYRHLDEPVDERVLEIIVEWVRARSGMAE
jgi:hypothetical protein